MDYATFERLVSARCDRVTPPQAAELALQLGRLAHWCLRPEVLELARRYPDPLIAELFPDRPPGMAVSHGSCWAVFTNPNPDRWGLLRDAFVLPFCWKSGAGPGHSAQLPTTMRALADEILTTLRPDVKELTDPWRLCWSDEFEADGQDLSWLPLKPASGWAALAAGLIVAALGGTPDPTVWATGTWVPQDRTIVEVGGLKQKVDVALEHGARQFFVPSPQQARAQELAQRLAEGRHAPPLKIGALYVDARQLRKALRSLTSTLQAEPTEADSFEVKAGYYVRKEERGLASQFYIRCLAEQVAQRHQPLVRGHLPDWHPTHLVTMASFAYELVPLTVQLLRRDLTHCLLLHTSGPKDKDIVAAAKELERWLTEELQLVCAREPISGHEAEMVPEILQRVSQFLAGVDPRQVLFDLTPGFRLVPISFVGSARKGSRLLNWFNRTTADLLRPMPGSELPMIWEVTSDVGLIPILQPDANSRT